MAALAIGGCLDLERHPEGAAYYGLWGAPADEVCAAVPDTDACCWASAQADFHPCREHTLVLMPTRAQWDATWDACERDARTCPQLYP